MELNVGGYDRIVRLVFGPVLTVIGVVGLLGLLAFAASGIGMAIAALALVVGLVFTVTGTVQQCPLNRALGIDTYRGERAKTPRKKTQRPA
ncbi:YgaP family membrane protein [Natronomonas sp. EA1]|uniref:YgaP family membrane protein n=1 Tax=Natronomonas sp. EA1 TaxID=3421655 RepID=UPI003EBE91A0